MKTIRWAMLPVLAAGVLFAVGCHTSSDTKEKDSKPAVTHDHPTGGPHKGVLVEWGEEDYHVEFTVDRKTQETAVYILGPDAKTYKPIKTKEITLTLKATPPVTIKLAASPQTDDPPGTSSRFVGRHEILGKEQLFSGEISGEVD